jgi:MoaA/NifB/PqqE/SkfB family radical SAM enzyme
MPLPPHRDLSDSPPRCWYCKWWESCQGGDGPEDPEAECIYREDEA